MIAVKMTDENRINVGTLNAEARHVVFQGRRSFTKPIETEIEKNGLRVGSDQIGHTRLGAQIISVTMPIHEWQNFKAARRDLSPLAPSFISRV